MFTKPEIERLLKYKQEKFWLDEDEVLLSLAKRGLIRWMGSGYIFIGAAYDFIINFELNQLLGGHFVVCRPV